MKIGKLNVDLDHVSQLESNESKGAIDDQLLNVDLFKI